MSRASWVSASSASKRRPRSSSIKFNVPFFVRASGRPSWLIRSLTSGISVKVLRNAPGAILSLNGSGTLASLKTAAYPDKRITPSSVWRASTSCTTYVRRSIFFILLLESASASSASILRCAQFCALSLKLESPPHKSQATNPAPGYSACEGSLFFGACPST